MDTLNASDAEAGAVATHPRVTLEDIEGAIVEVHYVNAFEAAMNEKPGAMRTPSQSLKLLTLCMVVVKNGFTVIGHSAPASPENFNPEFGKKLAYENAVRQLWPLMGFALRDRLAAT